MNKKYNSQDELEPEIYSDEFRALLSDVYRKFPDQFALVNCSEKAKRNFPELDVIEKLRADHGKEATEPNEEVK